MKKRLLIIILCALAVIAVLTWCLQPVFRDLKLLRAQERAMEEITSYGEYENAQISLFNDKGRQTEEQLSGFFVDYYGDLRGIVLRFVPELLDEKTLKYAERLRVSVGGFSTPEDDSYVTFSFYTLSEGTLPEYAEEMLFKYRGLSLIAFADGVPCQLNTELMAKNLDDIVDRHRFLQSQIIYEQYFPEGYKEHD